MKILISDPIAKKGVEILKDSGFEVDEKTDITADELKEIIKDYDAIIVRSRTKVTNEVIGQADNLKIIGRAGVGLDNIDLQAAKEKGIEVVNTPGATSISVAELALGMMFACARNIALGTMTLKQEKWDKKRLKGIELTDKTLGIVGIGRIGKELAKRARALGMEVIAADPYVKEAEDVEMVSLEDVLSRSDFISIHVPFSTETKYMISDQEFKKMKDGVIFVNCARGGVVDEGALCRALESGKVRAAGVDVYEKEPAIGHKFCAFDNVVVTPHIGAQAAEGQIRAGIGIAEKVRDYLRNQ